MYKYKINNYAGVFLFLIYLKMVKQWSQKKKKIEIGGPEFRFDFVNTLNSIFMPQVIIKAYFICCNVIDLIG